MAAIWAVVWSIAGALLMIGMAFSEVYAYDLSVRHFLAEIPSLTLAGALGFGILGAISGSVFAGLFALAERRRSLAALSSTRLAVWGVAAGAMIPTVLLLRGPLGHDGQPYWPVAFGFPAIMGAVCAVGALLLARRAPNDGTVVTGTGVEEA